MYIETEADQRPTMVGLDINNEAFTDDDGHVLPDAVVKSHLVLGKQVRVICVDNKGGWEKVYVKITACLSGDAYEGQILDDYREDEDSIITPEIIQFRRKHVFELNVQYIPTILLNLHQMWCRFVLNMICPIRLPRFQ